MSMMAMVVHLLMSEGGGKILFLLARLRHDIERGTSPTVASHFNNADYTRTFMNHSNVIHSKTHPHTSSYS
jgi:hypothetical protein